MSAVLRRSFPRSEPDSSLKARAFLTYAEHGAFLVLLAFWAVPFTRATGGRGVHHELLFAALLLLLLPILQAWRAPSGSLIAALLLALAALLVCVFAPSGWYGSDVAAGYAVAAGCYVAGRRYVRDEDRRNLVAVAICLAGLYQFEQAFIPWWGNRNASFEMSGTFYWHNPYAAFLLPGAILGLGLVSTCRRPWSLVGWVSTPICTAGIVFSSSRATMAALVAGWALVAAFGLRGRAVIARVVGALIVTAGVLLVLPGPPFFPHYSAPWAATAAREASGQGITQNGTYRTEFWREALQVLSHHPLVGSGFHELAAASALYTPTSWARSPLAHNGYLQALSDGGVLLGVPFLAVGAVVLVWALRPLWFTVRAGLRAGADDVMQLTVAIALLAALAHSAVDFDWSHPSILVETALLSACLAPAGRTARRRWWQHAGYASLAGFAGVIAVLIPALHAWQLNQPDFRHSSATMLADAESTFGDYRPAQAVLGAYADRTASLTHQQAAHALALTKQAATVDLHLALLRDAVGAETDLLPNALEAARSAMARIHGSPAPYLPDYALVLIDAGQPDAAAQTLKSDIANQVAQGYAAPSLTAELSLWAQRLGRGAGYACEYRAAKALFDASTLAGVPRPAARCTVDQGHG